jgi:hypothetical protein
MTKAFRIVANRERQQRDERRALARHLKAAAIDAAAVQDNAGWPQAFIGRVVIGPDPFSRHGRTLTRRRVLTEVKLYDELLYLGERGRLYTQEDNFYLEIFDLALLRNGRSHQEWCDWLTQARHQIQPLQH